MKMTITKTITYIFAMVMILGLPHHASANRSKASQGANYCERYFTYFEKQNKIPAKLLHSVSMIESGKWDKANKRLAPWPWTVNFKGKGYYFDNKREAINFVKKQLKRGHKSIDLGCMQINLKYHGHQFDSIDQMFEPRYNIDYSARFLKSNYKRLSNWKKAVGHYHSATPHRSRSYSKKVYATWYKLKKQKSRNRQYASVN